MSSRCQLWRARMSNNTVYIQSLEKWSWTAQAKCLDCVINFLPSQNTSCTFSPASGGYVYPQIFFKKIIIYPQTQITSFQQQVSCQRHEPLLWLSWASEKKWSERFYVIYEWDQSGISLISWTVEKSPRQQYRLLLFYQPVHISFLAGGS